MEHFIGAQVIYYRLDKDFDSQMASKDSLVIELRDKIVGLLNPGGFAKEVTERLCMSLSYLALHTTNSCW